MEKEKGTARTRRSISLGTAAALGALFLGTLVFQSCGDVDLSKMGKGATAGKATKGAVAGSDCVSCHTDKEKLKRETASIKAPPKSAMTSGKG